MYFDLNLLKKCQVFIKHFFRFLAAVRSTPPQIEKNAKFSLNIFFDFWRRGAARRQKSKKMPSLCPKFRRMFQNSADTINLTSQ